MSRSAPNTTIPPGWEPVKVPTRSGESTWWTKLLDQESGSVITVCPLSYRRPSGWNWRLRLVRASGAVCKSMTFPTLQAALDDAERVRVLPAGIGFTYFPDPSIVPAFPGEPGYVETPVPLAPEECG